MTFIRCPPFGIHNKLDVTRSQDSNFKNYWGQNYYFMQEKLEVNLKRIRRGRAQRMSLLKVREGGLLFAGQDRESISLCRWAGEAHSAA